MYVYRYFIKLNSTSTLQKNFQMTHVIHLLAVPALYVAREVRARLASASQAYEATPIRDAGQSVSQTPIAPRVAHVFDHIVATPVMVHVELGQTAKL